MKINKSVAYVITVYVLTGLYSLLFLKFPYGSGTVAGALTACYMFMPFFASLLLQKVIYKEPLKDIGIVIKWSNWYFAAATIPIVLVFLTLGINLLFHGVSFDATASSYLDSMAKHFPASNAEAIKQKIEPLKAILPLIFALQAFIAGFTINGLFAFGEEAGWRGFFMNALKGKKFYTSSIIIGIVWGFWHAPIMLQGHNYPDHKVAGVFMMVIVTLLLAPLFAYAAIKAGTVLAAAIMHGVFNASSIIGLIYIKGGSDLLNGPVGLAGMISLLIANIALFLYDRFVAKEKVIA